MAACTLKHVKSNNEIFSTTNCKEEDYSSLSNSSSNRSDIPESRNSGNEAFQGISPFDKHHDCTNRSENTGVILDDYVPLQTSTIIGDWPSTVKLGGCEIKFPAGALDKCTMVAFILTYEEKEKCRENVTVTPTLTCLPSGMQCIKPVTITLLSSYKDTNVNVMAQNRIGRIKDVVSCESGVVTFETKSFDCFWGVKEASKSNEADTKSMLFKLMPSDKKTSDPILECRILDSYADVADEDPKSYFQIDVKRNQDVAITLQSENAEVDPFQRKIRSKEMFRKNTVISREFSFIGLDNFKIPNVVICKIENQITKKEIKSFEFTFPLPSDIMQGVEEKHFFEK